MLLRGELTVVTEDNETLHMKAGDSIVEVVDKWHYGKNEGNVPAEIIVFYAGIVDTPITIKKIVLNTWQIKPNPVMLRTSTGLKMRG